MLNESLKFKPGDKIQTTQSNTPSDILAYHKGVVVRIAESAYARKNWPYEVRLDDWVNPFDATNVVLVSDSEIELQSCELN